MNEDFERVEEDLRRFYEVLFREPRFYHDVSDDKSPTHMEAVSLIFGDGKNVKLNCRGGHDYDAMCRPKYSAEPTATQIKEIIRREKKEPEAVRYWLRDERLGRPRHPVLEFPFDFIRKVLENGLEGSVTNIPYRIVDGDEV